MHRFGKSSIWTAAGFAFVSGLLLLPTQSSAQYINIEGMIRGALQGGGFQPYNGGGGGGGGDGYVRRRANSGYTNRHAKSQPKEQEIRPGRQEQGTGRHAGGVGQQQRPQRAAKLGGTGAGTGCATARYVEPANQSRAQRRRRAGFLAVALKPGPLFDRG